MVLSGEIGEGRIRRLDLDSFDRAVRDPDTFAETAEPFGGNTLELGPYAVATLTFG